jgi:hypothetical protein
VGTKVSPLAKPVNEQEDGELAHVVVMLVPAEYVPVIETPNGAAVTDPTLPLAEVALNV